MRLKKQDYKGLRPMDISYETSLMLYRQWQDRFGPEQEEEPVRDVGGEADDWYDEKCIEEANE